MRELTLLFRSLPGHQYNNNNNNNNYHRRSTGHLLGQTTTDYGFIDAPPPQTTTQAAATKFEPNRAGPQTPSAAQRPKSILSGKSAMGLSGGGGGNVDKQSRDSGGAGFTGEGETASVFFSAARWCGTF